MMKIAVIGSGNVGGTLGAKWAEAGHEVIFGVRDPVEKRRQGGFDLKHAKVSFAPIEGATREADVVVLAVPSEVMRDLIQDHGNSLGGKVLIDATNDFRSDRVSKVEELAEAAPTAMVFRAFNSLGWEIFDEPVIEGETADLFYCGPDEVRSRSVVEDLIEDIGLRPIRAGDLDLVPVVDMIGRLWVSLANAQGMGRRIAFKTLGA